MAESTSTTKYQNWPDSHEYDVPYKAPPKGANPAINGIVLSIAAKLVESSGLLSSFLYKNAGFANISKLTELDDYIRQRYDPTVIPIVSESEKSNIPNYNDPAIPNQSLLQTSDVPLYYSIRDYHNAYKSGKLTPTIVAKALLLLVRRDVPNPSIHSIAFLTSVERLVLEAAEASTKRWAEGKPLGLLDGVPLAVKDEVDLADYDQTYGSKFLFTKSSPESSWCVAKWQEAGAVIIGKTNMHEIGMDTTNNNPTTGTPKNPYNNRYYTGGSSGGSAYAVASGLVPVAMGNDGGGSIRIPSNYCGIYGLKTSHHRISAHPSPDIAGTTAVAGPMAADMDSLALSWRIMSTPDIRVSSSAQFPPPKISAGERKKIIGIYKPWYDNSDTVVKASCDSAVEWLKQNGYTVIDITIPFVVEGQLAHALTISMEAYNGVKDKSVLQPANRILMKVMSRSSSNDFLSAQKLRQIISAHLAHLWDTHGHDLVIVTPVTPNAGWSFKPSDLKSGVSDGDMTIRSMQYVWLANFTGCPSISAPVAYVDPKVGKGKVPVSLMGMGIWSSEEKLIEFGYDLEKYLYEVLEGGRQKPENWVDVFGISTQTTETVKTAATAEALETKEPATVPVTNGNGVEVVPESK